MGGKSAPGTNPNKGQNGSRRAASHATKGDRHVEREALARDGDDRYVTAKSAAVRRAPRAPPNPREHPDYVITGGLRVGALRDLYREVVQRDPGQKGKVTMRLELAQANGFALRAALSRLEAAPTGGDDDGADGE